MAADPPGVVGGGACPSEGHVAGRYELRRHACARSYPRPDPVLDRRPRIGAAGPGSPTSRPTVNARRAAAASGERRGQYRRAMAIWPRGARVPSGTMVARPPLGLDDLDDLIHDVIDDLGVCDVGGSDVVVGVGVHPGGVGERLFHDDERAAAMICHRPRLLDATAQRCAPAARSSSAKAAWWRRSNMWVTTTRSLCELRGRVLSDSLVEDAGAARRR